MEEPALSVENLVKSYGRLAAVRDISFTVNRGEVVGFLGPNGAGKTTTIRACLNLVRPTSGRVRVFDRDVASDGGSCLARVGALVESPALLPFLSGRDNLEYFRRARGGVGPAQMPEVLRTVRLDDRGRDRVSTYSLGMRQRLGLAIALLPNPDLVILDEPANGLDPAGIVEMRQLLRGLAVSGKAVLVSSHALHEVEETCDRVVIVADGRVVREGSLADLTAGGRTLEELFLELTREAGV